MTTKTTPTLPTFPISPDDLVATINRINEAFAEYAVNVHIATLFAKAYQGHDREIAEFLETIPPGKLKQVAIAAGLLAGLVVAEQLRRDGVNGGTGHVVWDESAQTEGDPVPG